jgi:hypothetical protein
MSKYSDMRKGYHGSRVVAEREREMSKYSEMSKSEMSKSEMSKSEMSKSEMSKSEMSKSEMSKSKMGSLNMDALGSFRDTILRVLCGVL